MLRKFCQTSECRRDQNAHSVQCLSVQYIRKSSVVCFVQTLQIVNETELYVFFFLVYFFA